MSRPEVSSWQSATAPLLRLSLPIVGVNVGMMLMGAVDTIMVGRVSPEAIAAVALGNVFFFALSIFGVGVLLGLDPILAQALGAHDHDGFAIGVQRGLVLAAIISVPLALAFLAAEPLLRLARQPAEVLPLVGTYCVLLIPGMLPFLAFSVGRQSLQALQRVAPVVWTIILANIANIALNYVLIFGHLGFPPLGVAGSAWASTLSRWLMALLLLWVGRDVLQDAIRPWRREARHLGALGRLFRLGFPIGIQLEIEMAAFSTVALLMGTFGTLHVAGHQIALNLASLTFMVPMGVGMAAAVQVGRAVGRSDTASVHHSAKAALVLGAGFMGCTALIFLAVPTVFARLYTTDPGVMAFAATLLPIAGVFQVFDGLQVVSAGILRGLGETRAPMLINLVGFAGIGVTSSVVLAYYTPLGPVGLWWGLVIGLGVVALILMLRVRQLLRRPLARLHVER
ncbi:MAG: MATE family efflux transporter [Gemmatimonadales bacterium]|nr:MATE family efflux transporter [Gemmatimonadales bacterium]MDZ4390101.1 MATE family efflux transporter [Gemmatimonadales bacterium]